MLLTDTRRYFTITGNETNLMPTEKIALKYTLIAVVTRLFLP
jgi:hypothetical protein